MSLFEHFAEAFAPETRQTKLCDGDCGNVYNKEDLDRTCDGRDFCKDCMFIFLSEQHGEDANS